jgi:hypothetical protein
MIEGCGVLTKTVGRTISTSFSPGPGGESPVQPPKIIPKPQPGPGEYSPWPTGPALFTEDFPAASGSPPTSGGDSDDGGNNNTGGACIVHIPAGSEGIEIPIGCPSVIVV